jgi:uncharacterized membrane protein
MIVAADRGRWPLMWTMAGALVLVREDLIPLVGFFGLYLWIKGERRRGAVLLASSLVAFALVLKVVIPYFSDSSQFGYTGTYRAVMEQPWTMPATLVTPFVKIRTAALWFLSFAGLPLGSVLSVLLVPFALSRFLSSSPNHWGTIFHYSAPLAPILAMAAGDTLARLASGVQGARARARLLAGFAAACVVLSAVLPGHQPHWRLFRLRQYQFTSAHRAGYDVIARIPRDAAVVAQAAVVPHLSQRERVYVLDERAPEAEFVVMATSLSPWPMPAIEDVERLAAERRARGYAVVIEQDGWTLLRRSGH